MEPFSKRPPVFSPRKPHTSFSPQTMDRTRRAMRQRWANSKPEPMGEKHALTLPWVEAATSGFVNAKEMQEAFSLAIASGLNVIFSGPGGHGKSEFLMAAIAAIQDIRPYVMSFGQGTSNEGLYGGIDLDALNRSEGAAFQYNAELSFLKHPVAVFEELFDAPSRVLTSLKDTLTAKKLRNGHQEFDMATRVIFAATNHSPQAIAEGGPEIGALVERFPIQLEVKWERYDEEAYMALFGAVTKPSSIDPIPTVSWDEVANLQQRTGSVTVDTSMQRLLARIVVELRKDKVIISPRTAVFAIKLAQAAAVINGRDTVESRDFRAIAFLPGVHELKDHIHQLIEEFARSLVSERQLEQLEEKLEETQKLTRELMAVATSEDLAVVENMLNALQQETWNLRLETHLASRRDGVVFEIDRLKGQVRDQFLRLDGEKMEKRLREIQSLVKKFNNNRNFNEIDKLKGEVSAMQVHSGLYELKAEVLSLIRLTEYGR